MSEQTLRGPDGLVIELDSEQIFPNDPGQGTPAMVIQRDRGHNEYCATFNCASSEGVLEGDRGKFHVLNQRQCAWLTSQEDVVDRFITEHSRAKQQAVIR